MHHILRASQLLPPKNLNDSMKDKRDPIAPSSEGEKFKSDHITLNSMLNLLVNRLLSL